MSSSSDLFLGSSNILTIEIDLGTHILVIDIGKYFVYFISTVCIGLVLYKLYISL